MEHPSRSAKDLRTKRADLITSSIRFENLVKRFDANSYLYLSRAMDLYDVSEGYASLEDVLRRVRSNALFIGIRSDFLFPAARVRELAEQVRAVGGDASYVELDSPHGHDAFLKEWQQMTDALSL